MKTYIALLRGINVSGQKKIKMVDLKVLLEGMGFMNVQTYIQSGNIVFKAKSGGCSAFAKAIQEKIKSAYNFEVPVFVMKGSKLKEIWDNCPFEESIKSTSYFTLLHTSPSLDVLERANTINLEEEEFYITNECVYLYAQNGYGRARGNNNFFERKLKVVATTRNYRTMQKLIELST